MKTEAEIRAVFDAYAGTELDDPAFWPLFRPMYEDMEQAGAATPDVLIAKAHDACIRYVAGVRVRPAALAPLYKELGRLTRSNDPLVRTMLAAVAGATASVSRSHSWDGKARRRAGPGNPYAALVRELIFLFASDGKLPNRLAARHILALLAHFGVLSRSGKKAPTSAHSLGVQISALRRRLN